MARENGENCTNHMVPKYFFCWSCVRNCFIMVAKEI